MGYDPATGEQAMPWLENTLYQEYLQSGLSVAEFLKQAPKFNEQSLDKKPAKALIKQGLLGLDCRFLNFAPQCKGWMNLTRFGGSGSFVIFWSGLWKLTTAATIPYYTGQYNRTPRGFGFITIGANVHEFHAPAVQSKQRLASIIEDQKQAAQQKETNLQQTIESTMSRAFVDLSTSTLLLTLLVIGIAIWMASYLRKRITLLINGINRLEEGDLAYRLKATSDDEMGLLTHSINTMADHLDSTFHELKSSQHALQQKNEVNKQLMRDMRDEIEERKKAQQSLNQLAYYDELTELPNRFHLMEYLDHALKEAHISKERIAVFFLDLDGFKYVNDTLGHNFGDKLLLSVANRLKSNTRRGDFIARLGGDEFTIIVRNAPDDLLLGRIASNFIEVLSKQFNILDNDVYISGSIGIATYPENASNINDLLKHADMGMYYAKDQGKGCFRFWNEDLKSHSDERLKLASNLRNAIANNEFTLYFQPKLDAETLELQGFEALLRWKTAESGFIPPDHFIPVAEETGVIFDISRWVFAQVAMQLNNWQQQGFKLVPVSVNVSAREFSHAEFDLPALIQQVSEAQGVSTRYFDVELTETHMMQSPDKTIEVLQQLKQIDVTASIDDFGTGYSSLTYLRRFPVNTLKIDKSFVRDLEIDQSDVDLTRSIIEMGRGIGLSVVAEGVETLGQQNLLREMGCDLFQGYLFSKPLPADEMVEWMKPASQN